MTQHRDIFQDIHDDLQNANLDESTKQKVFSNLMRLKKEKVNLLITGATGSGKSSTINALFDMEVAKVGVGVDPETMHIEKYELDNLILWDSPGLGDGKEKDRVHAQGIINKLTENDIEGNALIDLVLVIVDGSSRDLGTSYELINQVIIPNLGENPHQRILIAINQADVAMKGRHWDYERNRPEPTLVSFLEEKVSSVQRRVKEATGVDVSPIYYVAGYKEKDEIQIPWNLSKLLYLIITYTPSQKRLAFIDHTNSDANVWKDDDRLKEYGEEIRKSYWDTIREGALHGAELGGRVGEQLGDIFGMGKVGKAVGSVIGGVVGAIGSLFGF